MTAPLSAAVAGFAACTSLGYSLESTLAAMGAGLNNFTATDVPNEFGHATVAASLFETGGSRRDRLVALLRHGFDDVRALVREGLAGVPVLIGVPSDLDADERRAMQTVLREQEPLIGETTWFPYGRASTFAALTAALDMFARRSERLALVAGVDSLCAPAQLRSLVRAGRVLSPYTEGTIPGEAAAFALLARPDDLAVAADASVTLEAVVIDRTTTPITQADVVSGDALTALFRQLRVGGARRVHRVVAAHSGEGYFGRSFAHAYLREVEMMPEPLVVELIADRVGDTGAAAGVLGLAFASYLMVQDGRDGESRALTYGESDTGEVGAAILRGSPREWRRSPRRKPGGERLA